MRTNDDPLRIVVPLVPSSMHKMWAYMGRLPCMLAGLDLHVLRGHDLTALDLGLNCELRAEPEPAEPQAAREGHIPQIHRRSLYTPVFQGIIGACKSKFSTYSVQSVPRKDFRSSDA